MNQAIYEPHRHIYHHIQKIMRIKRSISEPIRAGLTWNDCWKGEDQGLITCWETGRKKKEIDPSLASEAIAGRLVVLPWKGGVKKAIKGDNKYGVFNYIAMWQGLRGQDLDIDTDIEIKLTCSVTGVTVTFTSDYNKYAQI